MHQNMLQLIKNKNKDTNYDEFSWNNKHYEIHEN